MQPSQQQGRRMPSLSSLTVLWTCSFLVSSFLTKVTQQIHSLRARGVRPSHIARACGSEVKASRRSAGILWTVPAAIFFVFVVTFSRIRAPFFVYCSQTFTKGRGKGGI